MFRGHTCLAEVKNSMLAIENSWPNLVGLSWWKAAAAMWSAMSAMTCAMATTSAICQKTPAANQDSLLVVDSAYRSINSSVLQIGEVDFSVLRNVSRRFLVIAPLRARPTTNLGGVAMRSELELLQKCPGKNVFSLNFSFDSSVLPVGAFSEPLAVYQDEFGMKGSPLSAPVEAVAGFVKRVWMDARAESMPSESGSAYRVHLTNSGNVTSGALRLIAVSESSAIRIRKNSCDGLILAPSKRCEIEVVFDIDRVGDARLNNEVAIGLTGVALVENTLWLNLQDRKLQVFTTNR